MGRLADISASSLFSPSSFCPRAPQLGSQDRSYQPACPPKPESSAYLREFSLGWALLTICTHTRPCTHPPTCMHMHAHMQHAHTCTHAMYVHACTHATCTCMHTRHWNTARQLLVVSSDLPVASDRRRPSCWKHCPSVHFPPGLKMGEQQVLRAGSLRKQGRPHRSAPPAACAQQGAAKPPRGVPAPRQCRRRRSGSIPAGRPCPRGAVTPPRISFRYIMA